MTSDINCTSTTINNERQHLDENLPKHLNRSYNMSISKLEDLIMCPIHLGMMEDPRILSCGHAFCLNCLISCLSRMVLTSNFCCPVCRRVCDFDHETVNLLPPSIAIKQLTDYIVEEKSRTIIKQQSNKEYLSNESIVDFVPTSVDQKDLVNHLLRERGEYSRHSISCRFHCNKLHSELVRSIESPLLIDNGIFGTENIILHSSTNLEVFNSTYELMDIETIRENMKKYSAYKIVKETNNLLINCRSSDGNKMIVADVKLVNHESEMVVWIGDKTNVIMVKTWEHTVHEFVINIDSCEATPIFLKFYNNNLIFLAKVRKKQMKTFRLYLIQCSFNGKIIYKTLLNSNYDANTHLGGFHLDSRRRKILLALPNACKIATFSDCLVEETDSVHQFVDLHPTFVTQNNETGEIWASCPQDAKIIIIDEKTGSYRLLATGQIYNAIPTHITTSEDNRVMFLDSHQNRVFWIRKRNDFILIQRVTFSGHFTKQLNGKILFMSAVTGHDPVDRLMFSVGNNGYIVRPAKKIHDQNHKHLMCNIV